MKIYYSTLNDMPVYLISSLRATTSAVFEAIPFSLPDLIHIENHETNFLLFSSFKLEDIRVVTTFIDFMRTLYKPIRIRIVCGGAAHYMISNDDLRSFYPEITHICIGKGENMMKTLITDGLAEGIHHAGDFGMIQPYVVAPEYKTKDHVLLTFSDNRCNWNRCLFCHHTSSFTLPLIPPEVLADQIKYYIDVRNNRNFTLYDNNLNPEHLRHLLEILIRDGYASKPFTLYLFGLRVDSPITILEDVLDQWMICPIEAGAWGVEFYDQDVLDLFCKNSTLEQIDRSLSFFHRHGISNNVYLLLGLPSVRNAQIAHMAEFMTRAMPIVRRYFASYFLLNPGLTLYNQKEAFKITEGEPYTTRDYFSADEKIPCIRTAYQRFSSWDEDEQRYLNRDETFLKYLSLYQNPKLDYKAPLYFLTSETRSRLREFRKENGLAYDNFFS